MKKLIFTLLTLLAVNASAQLVYPTDVFWEFLSGYQAGDSATDNYLKYNNNYLLLKTDQRDAKVLQIRNELNTIGISTLFIDANGNGGLSIDSAGGQTVIKLRGALNDHSYINNSHVSIGRGGQSQDYGGNVDGAKFTVSDDREPGYGLWDADNYQMMLQSSKDSIGGYVGLAFTSENATQDRNVGAFINYLKTGNNGKGELHFGTKTATGSLADGIHAMKIYDGSVTIDSTIVLPNIPAINSDTVLVARNDSVGYKVLAASVNKTILASQPVDVCNGSTTEYGGFGGSQPFSNESSRDFVISSAGTITRLYFRILTSQPVDGDCVVTVRKNGVNTAMTVTIPAGASGSATYSDVVNSFTVVAGDILTYSVANASASASTRITSLSVEFTFN